MAVRAEWSSRSVWGSCVMLRCVWGLSFAARLKFPWSNGVLAWGQGVAGGCWLFSRPVFAVAFFGPVENLLWHVGAWLPGVLLCGIAGVGLRLDSPCWGGVRRWVSLRLVWSMLACAHAVV